MGFGLKKIVMESKKIAVIPMSSGARNIQFDIIDVMHTFDFKHLLLPHRHDIIAALLPLRALDSLR
jgi:hypothetical protein